MTQGIYFHIPFCIKKCPYCDFLSYPVHLHEHHRVALLNAMQKNVSFWKENRDKVDTIFFGGGTPSLLKPDELSSLIESTVHFLNCDEKCEITIEANPGTVDREYFRSINQCGVNRVSIGVQSFDDRTLKRIGRIHTSVQAVDAVRDAIDAGIQNVSVDLMIGLPEQTIDEIVENVSTAIRLGAVHLSCYDLTISKSTEFGRQYKNNELILPDDDMVLHARECIDRITEEHGFARYEISNYAKESYECRHNLHYWHNHPYIGIGPGAVGKSERTRYQNASDIEAYIHQIEEKRVWDEVVERTSEYDDAFDVLMLGTRLKEGIGFHSLLRCLSDDERDRWEQLARVLNDNGLIELKNGRLLPTKNGWNVQNAWLSEFLKIHYE